MFFVLLEVVAKHAQRFFEGVRANRVNARSYLSKLVKIKNQFITPLQNKGGGGAQPPYTLLNIEDIPFYISSSASASTSTSASTSASLHYPIEPL